MLKEIKISVVVPVYNAQQFLKQSVESVLAQTYPGYELILVDDGSSDASASLCDSYAERYENIRTVHMKNQGPLAARQRGIGESGGEVIVFLDADDCLRRDALEQLARCFGENRCDMVLYNAGTTERFPTTEVRCGIPDGSVFTRENWGELMKYVITGNVPNALWLKAVRKTCAELPMDPAGLLHVRQGEDLLLSICYMDRCRKIMYLDQDLYFYRVSPGSITHTYTPMRQESIKTVHGILSGYLDKWGLPELKQLHEVRKVESWLDSLRILLQSRHSMDDLFFRAELNRMSEDPYFQTAYRYVLRDRFSRLRRMEADCLFHKKFAILILLQYLREIRNKRVPATEERRKHGDQQKQ